MDSVHHIWCPLSSQEYQDLPDGAETVSYTHLAPLEQQIIVDPMLTSELRYGDLWSMREFNHFDFELNGIIRAFFTHCG